MDPSLQVKLLRVLDAGEMRRVGDTAGRHVSVRILASTNIDVEVAMEDGLFRKDLFYRLNVMHIEVPPLRDRKEDIIPLVEHFVHIFNKKMGLKISHISREAREALLNCPWKGNVRELQNVVERAMILTVGDAITLECLPSDIRVSPAGVPDLQAEEETMSLKKASKALEKTLIVRALNRTGGNRSQAAQILEISYPSLLQKIKDYGLS